MHATVKIDLHNHSTHSDGALTPSRIARDCAEREIRFAALTDHNTIDGLDAFESACEHYGIGFISGLEASFFHNNKTIHLLCYGFDRTDPGLLRILATIKATQSTDSPYTAVQRPGAEAIIRAVHNAGGIAIFAHPMVTEHRPDQLEQIASELFDMGLDGLETGHPLADQKQQEFLHELAARHKGVVSSGTDHHGQLDTTTPIPGVDVPVEEWRDFRDRLIKRRKTVPADRTTHAAAKTSGNGTGRIRMLIPMVLPALAVIGLFAVALFGFFLPTFEESLLERKRETIRELTRTIWSMLDEAEKQVQSGQVTPEAAREQASERIRGLRYGREGLDYFWLQDLSPRMIMHPYRPDLDGQDLSDFRDPRGTRIFIMFADEVRRDGSGYVDYVWQWKDDPTRLEAKESYIKLFEPWGWVIGTGLYINDVNAEIKALELRIYHVMLAIIGALVLLLLFMVRGGLKSERLRLSAERRLHESNARYASLVQAAAEGVLFVRNQRCVYANPIFMELADCDADELPLLDWHELFPGVKSQELITLSDEKTMPEVYHDTLLRRRDGTTLACRMALKGMPAQGSGSFVVLLRRSEENGATPIQSDESLLKRLLNLPSAAAQDIACEIAQAETPEIVMQLCRRTPDLVRAMLESGAAPSAIAGMISSITDSATVKFIELTQMEIGPEPAPFAFAVVGSQGRMEQTLYTDQDNIIMYNPEPGKQDSQVTDYFATLSQRVCSLLAQAGYRECTGQLMASNLKWRQPLKVWLDMFSRLIGKAEGHEAMDLMTLFDMRCVHGQAELVRTLRTHINSEISRAPWFFTQAARNAVQFKTPLRILGNIVTAGRATEKSGHLDLKAAMMPIVCYARLYALKHQLTCTVTSDRLNALSDQGRLLPSRYHDITTAFETLMRLRLRHQSETLMQGAEPDNLIKVGELGHIDEAVLKECFSEIDLIQKGIANEFLGGETGVQ